tara:strand:+ start:3375 stop:3932 length:558 start_codon:yes stop_codon:yes gene_type:complete
MQTLTGRRVHFLDPKPSEISLADIAGHLAKINRFGGATREPYSVAQHSVEVAMIVPAPWRGYALLHDAHEAYIGDRLTPIKRAMAALHPRGVDPFTILEDQFDRAIHQHFGLPWPLPPEAAAAVKQADLIMLATERRDLLNEHLDWQIDLPLALPHKLRGENWQYVEASFLAMAKRIGLDAAEGW